VVSILLSKRDIVAAELVLVDGDAAMAEWLRVSRLESYVHLVHVARPEIDRIELVRKLSSSLEAPGEFSMVSVPPAA
jgi:hypothetical protein